MLVNLDLAMTFMDVAEASRIEETKHRNHNNARKAHDAIQRLMEELTLEAGQRQVIDARLALLKTRLQAVEQQF